MMHSFLSNHRADLIERCRIKVAQRPARAASNEQLENGIPLFLDQLIRTLRAEQTDTPLDGLAISGPPNGTVALNEVGETAAQHGKTLLGLGFTVDQVVHDYGDLCQAITDLAFERNTPFSIDEFRTLNRCLDNAIADAVTEFSYLKDALTTAKSDGEHNAALGAFAHELRNVLSTATLAFTAIRVGNLALSGATGSVLERSLSEMRISIDRSLEEVRSIDDMGRPESVFALNAFIADAMEAGQLMASTTTCTLLVSDVDADLNIMGNRGLLQAALTNLLQNAFKFTHAHSQVTLNAYAMADRIVIDVIDECGGLPPGFGERMFQAFAQGAPDRSGLGLGLSIARRSVEASGGTLTVRDVPGMGCVFTMRVRRYDSDKVGLVP